RERPVPECFRNALAAGASSIVRAPGPELLGQWSGGASQAHVLSTFGWKELMMVPIRAQGKSFGVLSLMLSDSLRSFDSETQALAEELGKRAALAVHQSSLYEQSYQT